MRRIGVLSDTHGYTEIIDSILASTADMGIEMWFHCGDIADDARYMATKTKVPVIMVRGNCDRQQPLAPREELVPFEDTYIYMVHGNQFNPFQREAELRFIARHYGAKLILSGHTHCHEAKYVDGNVLAVNPGSPVLPRDGSGGTFAIVTYESDEKGAFFSAEFIYVTDMDLPC